MNTIKHSRAWRNTALLAGLIIFVTIAIHGSAHGPDEVCSRFKTVIQDDLVRHGKLSRDSVVLFLPAKNGTDTFMQAQSLCIKLGAAPDERGDASQVYRLAGDAGKITLHLLKNDNNIYAILLFEANCLELKIKEIRYVSLKAYGNIGAKKEMSDEFSFLNTQYGMTMYDLS